MQVPSGETTVVQGDDTMTFAEAIAKVETKKSIQIENPVPIAKWESGKHIKAMLDQLLYDHRDLEKIIVHGTICLAQLT